MISTVSSYGLWCRSINLSFKLNVEWWNSEINAEHRKYHHNFDVYIKYVGIANFGIIYQRAFDIVDFLIYWCESSIMLSYSWLLSFTSLHFCTFSFIFEVILRRFFLGGIFLRFNTHDSISNDLNWNCCDDFFLNSSICIELFKWRLYKNKLHSK